MTGSRLAICSFDACAEAVCNESSHSFTSPFFSNSETVVSTLLFRPANALEIKKIRAAFVMTVTETNPRKITIRSSIPLILNTKAGCYQSMEREAHPNQHSPPFQGGEAAPKAQRLVTSME